jgi:hypothetical protein
MEHHLEAVLAVSADLVLQLLLLCRLEAGAKADSIRSYPNRARLCREIQVKKKKKTNEIQI